MAIKIIFDTTEEFEEFSTAFTNADQSEPCGNCKQCKKALKTGNIEEFCYQTNISRNRTDYEQELNELQEVCERCVWYAVDEYEIRDE